MNNEFNEFVENLMKVVLVPDETSDAVEEVTPEPQDIFSQTASNYMDSMGPEDDSCCGGEECGGEEYGEEEESDVDTDATVSYDTTGLKVNVNGMDITIPNDVVEKIKEVINGEGDSDDEGGDDNGFDTFNNTDEVDSDDEDEDEDEELQEGDRLLQIIGWVALFKGKKLEISKKQANSIKDAKRLASKKWNVSEENISIEPAYAD